MAGALQAGGLFGQQQKPTLFGQPTAATQPSFMFGTGQPAMAQPALSGGLFGAKPASSGAGFSFAAPATSTGFGLFLSAVVVGFCKFQIIIGLCSICGTASELSILSSDSYDYGTDCVKHP